MLKVTGKKCFFPTKNERMKLEKPVAATRGKSRPELETVDK